MARPRTFKRFRKLPVEIQVMIWRCVCCIPQILPYNDIQYAHGLHPAYLVPPAVLGSCYQSRQVALTIYKKIAFNDAKLFFFNKEVDTIYLKHGFGGSDPTLYTLCNSFGLRSLAVDIKHFVTSSGRLKVPFLLSVIEKLPTLDELVMVVSNTRNRSQLVIAGFRATEEFRLVFRNDIAKLQMERFISSMEGLGIVGPDYDDNNNESNVNGRVSRPLPQIIFRGLGWGSDWRIHLPRVQKVLISP